MREGKADAARSVKQAAVDREGRAAGAGRRRHISGRGRRGDAEPQFADLALQVHELAVDRGDLRGRRKPQSRRRVGGEIAGGVGSDDLQRTAKLAPEAMPGVV
jgi:hypothetical protein